MACDACRMRKTRCDSESPTCGNCRIYDTTCERNLPRKKRGPKPLGHREPRPTATTTATATSLERRARTPPDYDDAAVSRPDSSPAYQRSITLASVDGTERTSQTTSHSAFIDSGPCRTWNIQLSLIADIESRGASTTEIAMMCIDTYIHHRFPLVPTIHVARLLDAVTLLARPANLGSEDMLEAPQLTLYNMRSFTLLTSVCSIMCAAGPLPPTTQHTQEMSLDFLSASRKMLALYEEHDIEQPDSTSMTIRLFQSNTLHYFGRGRAAIHVLRTACSLVLTLRLYEEDALAAASSDALETQLLRNAFWTLYQSAESAAVLSAVPAIMQEIVVSHPFTTSIDSPTRLPLLSRGGDRHIELYEQRAIGGFNLCSRIWKTGADVLLDLKLFSRAQKRADTVLENGAPAPYVMIQYMSFCSLLDNLPPWLVNPDDHAPDDEAAAPSQRKGLWSLRVNLLATFYCLKLMILRAAEKYGLCHLLGLTNDASMLAVRKIQIAKDMLTFAKSVPFHALQANGEPCVEKLRQAGAELLEIIHTIGARPIVAQAQDVFSGLLDVIASLNSKVSEELTQNMESRFMMLHQPE